MPVQACTQTCIDGQIHIVQPICMFMHACMRACRETVILGNADADAYGAAAATAVAAALCNFTSTFVQVSPVPANFPPWQIEASSSGGCKHDQQVMHDLRGCHSRH